jgi:hypothetical protein
VTLEWTGHAMGSATKSKTVRPIRKRSKYRYDLSAITNRAPTRYRAARITLQDPVGRARKARLA